MVARLARQFRIAFNYGRGFRYPSMTDLGTLGLTGDGFEVDYLASQRLGGTIGTTPGTAPVVASPGGDYSGGTLPLPIAGLLAGLGALGLVKRRRRTA